jgi:selenide,water dikinase
VDWPEAASPSLRALLTDPQTSGGLLVACAPEAVDAVLGVFQGEGHADAAVVGAVEPAGPLGPRIRVLAH